MSSISLCSYQIFASSNFSRYSLESKNWSQIYLYKFGGINGSG